MKPLTGATWKWGMWFRICGHGLSIELDRPCWFSERYGYRRVYRFHRLSVSVLPRIREEAA